ncbi:hypothetical protein K8Q93_00500 [Candidatus Parcubacteria bacterium]|nr:hypothetical protein [Candidatus Parcubacteria bacterium]
MNVALYWTIGFIALVILAVGAYFLFFRSESLNITGAPQSSRVCTMDVKLCPDGSYVSRIPPSCAFAACPAPTEEAPAGGNPDFDVKG